MLSVFVQVSEKEYSFSRQTAVRLIQTLSRFDSSVLIHDGSRTVNARSLLGIVSLGYLTDNRLEFLIDGPDEEKAAAALRVFFESGIQP